MQNIIVHWFLSGVVFILCAFCTGAKDKGRIYYRIGSWIILTRLTLCPFPKYGLLAKWFISSVRPITEGGGGWWILCLSCHRRWEPKSSTLCRLRKHINKNRRIVFWSNLSDVSVCIYLKILHWFALAKRFLSLLIIQSIKTKILHFTSSPSNLNDKGYRKIKAKICSLILSTTVPKSYISV